MVALEHADADLVAKVDRLFVIAAAENNPGRAQRFQHALDLAFPHILDQFLLPDQLDQIGAQLLPIDKVEGFVGQAVDTDSVAPVFGEFSGEKERVHVGKDIDLLQFHHDGAAHGGGDTVVEHHELGRQQGGDVQVDADLAGDGLIRRAAEHDQHPPVQSFGQVVEQPFADAQVDARHQGFTEIADRNEQLAEQGLGRRLADPAADELTADHIGHVRALQRLDDPAQHPGRQGLTLGLKRVRRAAAFLRMLFFFAFFLGMDHGPDLPQHLVVVPLNIKKSAEILVGLLVLLHQHRVVGKQESQFQDRGFHILLRLAFVDEVDVRVLQNEDLAELHLDQIIERVGGQAYVMLPPVLRFQAGHMNMDRAPSGLVLVEPVQVVEQ